ncbi:5995_t:CDS:2 [Entrophospora sp. SA101]|nr:5995_t:CDS:2 [Entrophospora sp. SA101]
MVYPKEEELFGIFPDILLDAENNLSNEKFEELCESLKNGVKKACDSIKKWLKCRTQLPLIICCLGSNNGPMFAHAFFLVFYNLQISQTPSPKEISYVESLKQHLEKENLNTFGLKEALQIPIFLVNFINLL